jgi:tol-pal system protein YbgF
MPMNHNRDTVKTNRLAVALWMTLFAMGGCGSGEEALLSDMSRLEQRITDLERSSGRNQVRVSDLDERVLLMEDRVEAQRLALERRGLVRQRGRDELPRYEAPPVEPAYSYLDELPVQVMAPGPVIPLRASDGENVEEIIITNESLRAWVDENGGVPEPSSQSATPQRRTTRPPSGGRIPPVVIGDRLPVTGDPVITQPMLPSESPLDLYQASLRAFNDGAYDDARGGFEEFLGQEPSDDYVDNALYWIGECYYATGDYSDALRSFQRVVQEFPDGNKVPDSLLKIGLLYELFQNEQQACEIMNALVETYPLTEAARRASGRCQPS